MNPSDHVHFLIQCVQNMSITRLVTILKRINAKELLKRHEEIKLQ
ncbi:MAG: hypothetical protein GY816_21015 [Cytophagales bacterium]|nr:hypothetical protein [Cytophagales bacterium]